MKILTIMTTKFDISGITNSVMNYYRYMDKSDMIIDFVAPNEVPDRLKDEIMENNGKTFELLMRTKNPFIYTVKLKKIIEEGEYDIVHAHGNSSTLFVEMFAAKLSGVKIRIAHSRNSKNKYKALHKMLYPFFKRSYTHAFACGVDAGKWLFRKDNFKVITNGNDIAKYSFNMEKRVEYRKKYNFNGLKVIGHVGHFNYQKNHEFLIEVFFEVTKLSPNYILLLIGDGPNKKEIEKRVNDLNLNEKVIFVGRSLDVHNIIQATDLMLLPSRYEGLPNVVIEWQIAALPSIISSNITEEVAITNLVKFLPLEVGPKSWAKKIINTPLINREQEKMKAVYQVTKAGYNVQENAKSLRKKYIKMYSELDS